MNIIVGKDYAGKTAAYGTHTDAVQVPVNGDKVKLTSLMNFDDSLVLEIDSDLKQAMTPVVTFKNMLGSSMVLTPGTTYQLSELVDVSPAEALHDIMSSDESVCKISTLNLPDGTVKKFVTAQGGSCYLTFVTGGDGHYPLYAPVVFVSVSGGGLDNGHELNG